MTNLVPSLNMLESDANGTDDDVDDGKVSIANPVISDHPAITFNMHKLFLSHVETNVFKVSPTF